MESALSTVALELDAARRPRREVEDVEIGDLTKTRPALTRDP
jgi:hypothetical protein